METSGFEPELMTCKVTVLPVGLYPPPHYNIIVLNYNLAHLKIRYLFLSVDKYLIL